MLQIRHLESFVSHTAQLQNRDILLQQQQKNVKLILITINALLFDIKCKSV